MPVIKNTILYSLFVVSSINFSLHAQQDVNIQDNDDLMLIFDNASDDLHPIEDADIVCLMSEIQNNIDTLELDLPAITDAIFTDLEQSLSEENQMLPISKDQLEELLDNECKQIQESLSSDEQIDGNCVTISVDCLEAVLSLDNGIALQDCQQLVPVQQNEAELVIVETGDDDIIPVPHDLINSVKKANKQKKKLEKLEKKEKANAYKKSSSSAKAKADKKKKKSIIKK